ncbi:Lysosomal alpha-glucosidase like protein [Argiope bruennichi]|uniref:Lysosomal alpha-glucosidase like protein n=1 Tax=Argiope bruennichi TaxID=94029 RepID=A0A8T0EN46_ARGBR|nr:Lysosomal alpha-glucosidase like protein [Argiope bruennichi]
MLGITSSVIITHRQMIGKFVENKLERPSRGESPRDMTNVGPNLARSVGQRLADDLLLLGTVVPHFAYWYSIKYTVIYFCGIKTDISPVCSEISDADKFDCHPDKNISEKSCLQRGCCYQINSKTTFNKSLSLGVPYCFFPSNYDGYSVSNLTCDERHIKADLKRTSPSGFPNDILNLRLLISLIDDYTVRIKITDANAARFEIPIPLNDGLKSLEKPYYNVTVDAETSQLTITRKATKTIIFKTKLSQLVYSDQLLQLSSYLPSPYLYGIGETSGRFLRNLNWTRTTLFNSDRAPTTNYPTYGSHPFYLSLEEDGNANGLFLFNSNAMDVILQPTPAITFRPIAWGFHLSRFGYGSLDTTNETLQRNIDAGILVDVQWNDIDYMDKNKDFTYDEDKFAALPGFVEYLHNKGMHYVIMTDPGISCSRKLVWTNGETVFPDFSHPKTDAYWSKQLAKFHNIIEYDGLWIDMNEPSNFYNGGSDGCMNSSYEDPPYIPNGDSNLPLYHKTICMTARHYSTIHYNEHNLMAIREAIATNQALRNIRKKRPFIISRASFAGQGRQSGHWNGDISSTWDDMRYTIPSLLNFNLFGMSMIGSDICGFSGNTTVELCARWHALGAFYPFARNHNDRGNMEQDPAILGPAVIEATRKAFTLRYVFLPYLYTLFARSRVFGDTVIRPLFFEFPEDKNSYWIDEQFLWGPGLMVVPVLYENTTNITAYFPKGTWYDVQLNAINSSGESISLYIPLSDNYVAFRGGYIFPAQSFPLQNTEMSRKQPFVLWVFLDYDMKAQGELYWDDGDSLDTYENGNYNLISFSASQNVLKSTIVNSGYDDPMKTDVIWVVGISETAAEVTVNGMNCKHAMNCETVAEVTVNGMNCKHAMNLTNEMNANSLLDRLRIFKGDGEKTLDGSSCSYGSVPDVLAISLQEVSLLSPLTVMWK